MSNGFTLSARQRIVLWREIQGLKASKADPMRLRELSRAYTYYGDQTCAADGLCMTTCPVEINVGSMVKELRFHHNGGGANWLAALLAGHMDLVTASVRLMLKTVNIVHYALGSTLMSALAKAARKISFGVLPLWTRYLPSGAARVTQEKGLDNSLEKIVYLPSCISRAMGSSRSDKEHISLTTKTEQLIRKAGYQIVYPENLDKLCCGLAFSSKGFKKSATAKVQELGQALLKASDNGRLPILCDTSPCLHHMKETLDKSLHIYEPIEFSLKFLADKLTFTKQPEPVVVHAVCSAKLLGLESKLVTLAKMCAEHVSIANVNCCGFAGDRGFTHPEMNEFGLRHLKEQIPPATKQGYATSRTCEIGLSQHGGIPYQSIFYLVDRVTVAKRR